MINYYVTVCIERYIFYTIIHFGFLLNVRFLSTEVSAFVSVYNYGKQWDAVRRPIKDVRYTQMSAIPRVRNSRFDCTTVLQFIQLVQWFAREMEMI